MSNLYSWLAFCNRDSERARHTGNEIILSNKGNHTIAQLRFRSGRISGGKRCLTKLIQHLLSKGPHEELTLRILTILNPRRLFEPLKYQVWVAFTDRSPDCVRNGMAQYNIVK